MKADAFGCSAKEKGFSGSSKEKTYQEGQEASFKRKVLQEVQEVTLQEALKRS